MTYSSEKENDHVFSAKADIYCSLQSVKQKEETILDCVISMCEHF